MQPFKTKLSKHLPAFSCAISLFVLVKISVWGLKTITSCVSVGEIFLKTSFFTKRDGFWRAKLRTERPMALFSPICKKKKKKVSGYRTLFLLSFSKLFLKRFSSWDGFSKKISFKTFPLAPVIQVLNPVDQRLTDLSVFLVSVFLFTRFASRFPAEGSYLLRSRCFPRRRRRLVSSETEPSQWLIAELEEITHNARISINQ